VTANGGLVERVLAEQGLRVADRRVAIGDPAEHIRRIAGEERAELVVVGSKARGSAVARRDAQPSIV
jgi:nucleotide-binding universal stress UspA family protein